MIIFVVIYVVVFVIMGNGWEGIYWMSCDNSWSGVSVRLIDFLYVVKLCLCIWFFCYWWQVGSGCCLFVGYDFLWGDVFFGLVYQWGKEINLIVIFVIIVMGYFRQQE